jgi:metal-dependent amidase/aminoacylase/carboxypeptidase family protein
MSSEDFGHFLEYVPGCFLFLGGREDKEDVYPLHHAKFDYKDDNLILAAKFFTEIVRLKLT